MTTGFFTADREPALSLEIRGPDGAQSHGASLAIRTAPPCSSLSILTGPRWTGTSRAATRWGHDAIFFQSSPARDGPVHRTVGHRGGSPLNSFNSHRPGMGRCIFSLRHDLVSCRSFNPHRPRMGRCNDPLQSLIDQWPVFQSSPAWDGPVHRHRVVAAPRVGVLSILTGPGWAGASSAL